MGSTAWDAGIEIDKIGRENGAIQRELSQPGSYARLAGGDGIPHLRHLSGTEGRLRHDEATRTFVENDGTAPTRTAGNGSGLGNEANWQVDGQGRLTEVTATLREHHVNMGRSAEELAAQSEMRMRGIDGDDAGHAVWHRFMLDNGPRIIFPQNANGDSGAHKTLENEMSDWVAAGGEVRVTVRPG